MVSFNCPRCNSDAWHYVEGDERFVCPVCGYRPPYYGRPPWYDLLCAQKAKPEDIDPRFGKLLGSGKGVMKIGDKEFPIEGLRIVPYNPDGDPARSWEPPRPKTTDGEE